MNFRRVASSILLILISLRGGGTEVTKTVMSGITAVTVYSDRAVVTRKGTGHFSSGHFSAKLTGLPASLNDQSVRVSGTGPAKILEVRVESVFSDSITNERSRALQEKLKVLNDQARKLDNRVSVLNQQKDFLNKISISSQDAISKDLKTQRPTIDDWQKLLGFFDANLTRINDELFDLDHRKADVSAKISALMSDWNKTGTSGVPREKTIIVGMEVQSEGNVNLEASYLVPNAGWEPIYDIRVSSADTKVELSCHGLVWQTSGEDWTDISLSLSTAQPSVGGTQPKVSPWYVDQYGALKGSLYGYVRDASSEDPLGGANVQLSGPGYTASTDASGYYSMNGIPAGSYEAKVTSSGFKVVTKNIRIVPNRQANFDARLETADLSQGDIEARDQAHKSELFLRGGRANEATLNLAASVTAYAPPPLMEAITAEVSESATSATFEIPTKSSIPTDKTKHKVTIAVASLAGEFSYSAAPKLRPNAFFKATLVNTAGFPLLSGPMSVFVDNGFVATSQLSTVAPGEKFDAFLGVDNGIRVERILVSRLTETGGVFSKITRVTYNAVIKIENLKKTPQALSVQDNLPFSQNEKIEVKVDSPLPDEATHDANGIVTWKITVNPGEKRDLRLAFSVEYPADLNIVGLE